MASISARTVSSTSIEVTWYGVAALSHPGAIYNQVRVDEYRAATIAALKSGQPLPPADQSQGGSSDPSRPTLSPLDGSVALFVNLAPNTSYVFVLYGLVSLGSGGGLQPVLLATSQPATTSASSPAPAVTYPALSTRNFPKNLAQPNRIVVSCANANAYDHWILSVNNAQQSQQFAGDDTFTIASVPYQTFVLNADGKIHNGDYTGWGPPIPVKAGGNSNSVEEFLRNSGVSGAGGLRGFLNSSNSTTVRNMLGL